MTKKALLYVKKHGLKIVLFLVICLIIFGGGYTLGRFYGSVEALHKFIPVSKETQTIFDFTKNEEFIKQQKMKQDFISLYDYSSKKDVDKIKQYTEYEEYCKNIINGRINEAEVKGENIGFSLLLKGGIQYYYDVCQQSIIDGFAKNGIPFSENKDLYSLVKDNDQYFIYNSERKQRTLEIIRKDGKDNFVFKYI